MSQVAPRVIIDTDDSSLGPALAVLSKIGATVVRGCDTADKIIARSGIGVDNVDLDAATDKGILVTVDVRDDLPGEEL